MEKIYNKLASRPFKSIMYMQLVVYILCTIFYYELIPYLLNYPPNSINTDFQLAVNPTYYWVYYLALCIVCVLIVCIMSAKVLCPVTILGKKELSTDEKLKIRKACNKFSISYIFLYEVIFPCAIVLLGLLILRTDFILTLKITLIVFIFLGIPAIIFYILSNAILKQIFIKTFDNDVFKEEKEFNSYIWKNIVLQIFPAILVTVVFIFLVFMTNLTNEISEYKYQAYEEKLNNTISELKELELSQEDILAKLKQYLKDENWFVKIGNEYYYSDENEEISDFMKKYIEFYVTEDNSKIYDSYGETKQGIVKIINSNQENILIGITYDTLPQKIFVELLSTIVLFLILDFIIIYMTSKILGDEVRNIANRLFKISKANTIKDELIPITSDDELAMLTGAFNEVQLNTKQLITKIENNQDILMERERLAALGQLIGGIAHNLKTPIMSVAGAAEGLTDLINEYDTSIEDPEVNFQDHHDIANDMREWITKIRSYIEYMSDIITAVKGQAVAMSEQEAVDFTVDELVKRVNILMRHELKNAVIYLNVKMQVNPELTLKGEINGLVQIINNMISNSIQAYNGKTEQNIDMILSRDNGNLIISIRDYAGGLPKKVKEKLFKEMITTKGKNGTGLGLYMSYSNIKAHFNGNITYDSIDGQGTTFNIILPLER